MECRAGCGACCEAISISSPIPSSEDAPGLPFGKPAGIACPHLSNGAVGDSESPLERQRLCGLFGKPERPSVCGSFRAHLDTCGSTRAEAFQLITIMELLTRPNRGLTTV